MKTLAEASSFTLSFLLVSKTHILANCLIVINIPVYLLAISGGISIGWSSSALPKLTNPNRTDENPTGHYFSEDEKWWTTATLFLVASAFAYPWLFLADWIGRRATLLLVAIPMTASYLMSAFATTLAWFLLARGLIGFANAALTSVVFVYVAEIVDAKEQRAILLTFNSFAAFGVLLSYSLGTHLSIEISDCVAVVVPAVFLCLFLFFGLESPVFLLKHNKRNLAYKSLQKLRNGFSNVDAEMEELQRIKRNGSLKSVVTIVILVIFQQLSGVSVLLCYAEDILKKATNDEITIKPSVIVVAAIHFTSTFIPYLLINKIIVKHLLIISAIGMAVAQTTIATYFHLNSAETEDYIMWLPLILAVYAMFSICYNCAFAILPYVIAVEERFSRRALAAMGFFNYLTAFVVTILFKMMTKSIDYAGCFWIYAGCCAMALLFVILFVPETLGKKLTN